MAAEEHLDLASYDDEALIILLLNGTVARNRNFEFFSTERGRTVHKQAKTLEGVLHDLKNGAKIVSETKDEWGWRVVLENEENRYRRTVIMSDAMHRIFLAQSKKG